jgi:NAD(P)H dehydrogenase (quinone)
MRFEPAEKRCHFNDYPEDSPFDPLKAQERAASSGTLPDDVAGEIDKLNRADLLVFHFPLWWFAPPAVLKGWFDRVLAHGATHTIDERFDSGRHRGRKALFCVTAGATAAELSHNGKEGDVHLQLWPAAYTLRYLGFTVLDPEIVFGVHGYYLGEERTELDDRLQGLLKNQTALIRNLAQRPELPFNPESDFDADGRLKPDRPSHSPFIRHRP